MLYKEGFVEMYVDLENMFFSTRDEIPRFKGSELKVVDGFLTHLRNKYGYRSCNSYVYANWEQHKLSAHFRWFRRLPHTFVIHVPRGENSVDKEIRHKILENFQSGRRGLGLVLVSGDGFFMGPVRRLKRKFPDLPIVVASYREALHKGWYAVPGINIEILQDWIWPREEQFEL